jgi:pantetheine-phosphate adenylyltransferase
MITALCPGSFDPPTSGHVDLVDRALEMFDRVVVSIIDNPSKTALFTADERVRLFREIYGDAVEVVTFDGLLVEHAREMGVDLVVKGLRTTGDYEYETQMAEMNRHLSGIETVFVPTRPDLRFVSSSLVKEVARLGGSVSGLVPDVVEKALKERLQ